MRQIAKLWVVGLFVGMGLSGCFGGSDDDQDDDNGANDEGGDVMAVISVLANGTEIQPVNGTLPAFVNVTLTFDGAASNGTNLSYAWDFDDGATGNNSTEMHAFMTPSLYNVTLTVSRGNRSDTASVLLNVSVSGPKPGDLVWTDRKDIQDQTLAVGNPNNAQAEGTDHRNHAITVAAAAPDGTPALAKKVRITLDGSGASAVDMSVSWRSSAAELKNAQTMNQVDETLTYEGDMPAGNYVARVRFHAGVQATYDLLVEVDYFAT